MWRAQWNKAWGTRFPTQHVDLFFNTEPTPKEITRAFRHNGHPVDSSWENDSSMSGYITVKEIIPEW